MKRNKKKKVKTLDYVIGLFHRYEKDEVSDTERLAVRTWIPDMSSPLRSKSEEERLNTYSRNIWEHLAILFHFEQTEMPPLEEASSTPRRMFRPIKSISRFAAVAAIVLFLISGTWMAYRYVASSSQLSTSLIAEAHSAWATDGSHQDILTFPDGTIVQLNADSRIEISKTDFNREKREVWLNGEAFFQVSKNPHKPFIVHTGNMQTTVRGTSFNITAYPQLGVNVVSVKTGKVEVASRNKVLAMLTPNQQIEYNTSDGTSEVQTVNSADIAAWADGRFVLNNASALELKLRLKQHFAVNLQIDRQALSSIKFNAAFNKDTKLDEVMQTISILYGIRYKITSSGDVIINH